MITFLNRRELIVVSSLQQYSDIRRLLIAEGIQNSTKMGGRVSKDHGSIDAYATGRYTIYVHKNDYDRAVTAIQPALRNQ